MDILTVDRAKTPQAKRRQNYLLIAVWAWALFIFAASEFGNWGGLVAAGFFSVLSLVFHEKPYRIRFENDNFSISRGASILWSAPADELLSVEVEPEAKRLGLVFSPKRVVFRNRSGDHFAIDFDLFEEDQLQHLVQEMQ